jgi:hypothetical protein
MGNGVGVDGSVGNKTLTASGVTLAAIELIKETPNFK